VKKRSERGPTSRGEGIAVRSQESMDILHDINNLLKLLVLGVVELCDNSSSVLPILGRVGPKRLGCWRDGDLLHVDKD
jgi:hypothetical protein